MYGRIAPFRAGSGRNVVGALAGCLLLSVGTCALALAPPAGGDAPLTVQRVLKQGSVSFYRIVLHATPSASAASVGGDVTITTVLKETISDAKPDGAGTITDTIESAKLSQNDQTSDLKELQAKLPGFVQSLDKQGRLTEIVTVGIENPLIETVCALLKGLLCYEALFYPPKPVSVGDQWKASIPALSAREANVKREATVTLVGRKTVDGADSAGFKAITVATTTIGGTPQKGRFEILGNVDLKEGKILTVTGTGALDGGKISKVEFTIARIQPDAAASAAGSNPAKP